MNVALLLAAVLGAGLFVLAETNAASPLIRLASVRDPALAASLVMSALVSTVIMATLVIGPFYLARGLGLDAALVGIVMSIGPASAALAGVPAGRLVDRYGATRMTIIALAGMLAGCSALWVAPAALGIAGYVIPVVIITTTYALFQVANNTSVMTGASAGQRGVLSGMLNLSRNLGLITGASVMGAVFALASRARDLAVASADAVSTGMRVSYVVASMMIVVALAVAIGSRVFFTHASGTDAPRAPEPGAG